MVPACSSPYAAAEFYIRAHNRAELEDLRRKAMGCFEGEAKATGCDLTVSTRPDQRPYTDMVANDTLAALYTDNLATFGISVPTRQQVLGGPGGSTDMGDVSYVVPSIHPMFAIPTEAGNHTPGFTAATATPEAHAAAMRAAKVLAMTALDIFFRPAVLEAARVEFARRCWRTALTSRALEGVRLPAWVRAALGNSLLRLMAACSARASADSPLALS